MCNSLMMKLRDEMRGERKGKRRGQRGERGPLAMVAGFRFGFVLTFSAKHACISSRPGYILSLSGAVTQ